jgi:hypothetical protein
MRWGASYAKNYVQSGRVAYINKIHDVVYFADKPCGHFGMFWFLELLRYLNYERGSRGNDYKMEALALQQYADQFSGIQNVAMSSQKLYTLLHADYNIQWLQCLPSLKELTIIVGSTEKEGCGKPVRISPIKPGTVRAASASLLL